MKTSLTRISAGHYRHGRLGVVVEKTAMPDTPWRLAGPNPDGSGVVLARTLSDARAFLGAVEQYVWDRQALLALGKAVRYEREAHDFTAAALAVASGVELSQLKALEAGQLDPEVGMVFALARALDAPFTSICNRADALEYNESSVAENAERALLALHCYLFPERYEDVPGYEWNAGTIEDVAATIERALANHPRAKLTPK
jgi:transcriptional regulator with XRE-family HTH domain